MAALPAPEPNSIRAARGPDNERGSGGRADTPETAGELNILAAATARLKAATERSKAIVNARERALDCTPALRLGSVADHLLASIQEADRPISSAESKAEENDRRVLEMQRELDRERDRIEREWERKRGGSSAVPDEQRAPRSETERPSPPSALDKIEEILRQVQERDRAHREQQERDRSRDRGRSR